MTVIIDQRSDNVSDSRDAESRKKFIERNAPHIKKHLDKIVGNSDLRDIGKNGSDVPIPNEDIKEPVIHHGRGGRRSIVHPGNKEFNEGDRIARPQGGAGGAGGGDASDSGEGNDEFLFPVTKEEAREYLFKDLALPNMTKVTLGDTTKVKFRNAGFVSEGSPNNLSLIRTKRNQIPRRNMQSKKYHKAIIELLEEAKDILLSCDDSGNEQENASPKEYRSLKAKIRGLREEVVDLKSIFMEAALGKKADRIADIDVEIEDIEQQKKKKVPFLIDDDTQFRLRVSYPVPNAKAVMFCLMDVSGSMDQEIKDMAKRFYLLLYMFLESEYGEDQVDIVFIRHHTTAKEVDEQEFFYSRETGGTIVSSVLAEMVKIMADRYPDNEWNIYGAQASDGDNWKDDSPLCVKILRNKILDKIQGFFYTEITRGDHQALWRAYETLQDEFSDKFFRGHVQERADIYPVFRDFFEPKDGADNTPQTSNVAALKHAI